MGKPRKPAGVGTVTVPAGEYILGDPCYCFGGATWDELCRQWFGGDWKTDNPVAMIDGRPVIQFHTAHGDGCYYDQDGNEYPVDSGMIGLVPVALVQRKVHWKVSVKFEQPVECWSLKGRLVFGGYVIRTDR